MFDKFVRDKLRDHESPVPAGLWEKIERKKESRPRGGYWRSPVLWTAAILVTGLGLSYLLTDGFNGSASSVKDTDKPVVQQLATTTTQGVQSQGQDQSADHTTIEVEESPANGQGSPASTNLAGDSGNDLQADEKNQTENASIAGNSNNVISGSKRNRNLLTNPSITGWKRANQLFQSPTAPVSAEPEVSEEYSINRVAFAKGNTAYQLSGLRGFGNKQFSLSDLKIVGIDCPPNGSQRRNDWYLEVYGSPDVVMKSVEPGGNPDYLSKKDSTETQQLSYTAGFRISKSIGEKLLLKTGLQYSQINERFNLRTENERRIITVVTIRTVPSSTGADSTISDTTSLTQIGYREQRTYNRYRSLDIPLLLSYEFGDENLKLAVNAGAIINLYSWYAGNTLNDSLQVVSMNSKGTGIYKQNIGVGLYAGFSLIKPVSDKLDVFVEPYFRYNLSNMARKAAYGQRFNAAGISLGIRYKLKGQRSGVK